MAVYDLEEQEQLDELKTWWTQYGNLVTGALLVVAIATAGWQGWNWWQRKQSAEAVGLYGALQQAAAAKDPKRTRELAGELIDKFSGTVYAPMGALISAKAQVDAGDVKNARAQLTWAADHAGDDALRDVARLRLAGLLADDKSDTAAADEALKLLSGEPSPAFAARYAELRGDILAGQGKTAEARTAYEAALAKAEAAQKDGDGPGAEARSGAYREVLKIKLDALGGAAK